jgi:hypothetical protein
MSETDDRAHAGWYPDGPQLRYWDGSAWTEHTAPAQPAQTFEPPPRDKRAEKQAQREATAAERSQSQIVKAQQRAEDEAAKAARRAEDEAAKRAKDEGAKAAQLAKGEVKAAKGGDEVRPDILTAIGKMSFKMGSKREIKRLPEHLWENERVDLLTGGTYGSGTGVLVLTDRRLLFLKDGVMSKTSEDFPLEKISSIQWSTGMLLGKITVFASGNKAEILNVQKQDGKMITDAVRARTAGGTSAPSEVPAPVAPPASGPDVYEQLRKLGELHQAGVLTDEEFTVKKQQLLDQI